MRELQTTLNNTYSLIYDELKRLCDGGTIIDKIQYEESQNQNFFYTMTNQIKAKYNSGDHYMGFLRKCSIVPYQDKLIFKELAQSQICGYMEYFVLIDNPSSIDIIKSDIEVLQRYNNCGENKENIHFLNLVIELKNKISKPQYKLLPYYRLYKSLNLTPNQIFNYIKNTQDFNPSRQFIKQSLPVMTGIDDELLFYWSS